MLLATTSKAARKNFSKSKRCSVRFGIAKNPLTKNLTAQDECVIRFVVARLDQKKIDSLVELQSFHGTLRSLVANCQGLQSALPSLREFSKEDFGCIVYDEVSERQVLSNKLFFYASSAMST